MKFPSSGWPSKLTQRLGVAAILFGQVEYLLKLYVKQFLGSFRRGMIVTSRIQFNQLVELTSALVKHEVSDKKLRDAYFRIVKEIERAEKARNGYFHSAWGMDEQGNSIHLNFVRERTNQRKAGSGLIKNKNLASETDLDDLIRNLDEIKRKLRDLRLQIWPQLRPGKE
ncbi:MAG TPA: hypothetical protein PLR41_05560 [Alphaproteobacteria bacterium]|nr:hypothetical protein [Alphaproteobacteria bacterium]